CGAAQTFTITPDACHDIAGVLVDGNPVGSVSSYTFNNVTASHTITASFVRKTYNVLVSTGVGGSVSPSGGVPVNCGSDQTFTITPDACHDIADVTANHTIVASFALKSFTIPASAGTGGSISPCGAVAVGCRSYPTRPTSPHACHDIAGVVVDGNPVGASATYTFFNMTASHT